MELGAEVLAPLAVSRKALSPAAPVSSLGLPSTQHFGSPLK